MYREGIFLRSSRVAEHYLDVDGMLEKFGLAKEIRMMVHSIGNLRLRVERRRNAQR
jgi:hypothetical protein